MKTTKVLQTNISETNINEVSNILNSSTNQRVAICNANTLVRSVRNSYIKETINSFTIKTPDGFPVAKALSIISKQKFLRVDGYNVFLKTIEDGLSKNSSHYFFGSNEYITKLMINNLEKLYPEIQIRGYMCPEIMEPDLLVEKYKDEIKNINADIIWVSLGFPKQEIFIDKIIKITKNNSNFVGIGGVFEWVAGTKKKAPEWAANMGFEWLLRLIQDPKRLYKRYLIDNILFVFYFLRQVFFRR
ncbi:MAG: WecB/TagA/CpsF family glycosyltransferase [Gammaproteobacteria bacterium]|tara:strand:- start:2739 stop:3473 length:735 start_codon:yes stop_codon:yes gene_type:complete